MERKIIFCFLVSGLTSRFVQVPVNSVRGGTGHPHQLNHPLLQPVLEAAADSGKVQWGYFPNGDVFSSVRKKQTAIHGSVGFEMRGCSTERILLLSVRIPAGY